MPPPIISSSAASKLIAVLIPDCEWLLRRIESEQGWLRFPPQLNQLISRLKVETYPLLYEDERFIANALLLAFLDQTEICELGEELERWSPDERGERLVDLTHDIDAVLAEIVQELDAPVVAKDWELLTEDAKRHAMRQAQLLVSAVLASFYQTLSVMVHGEKLTSLVSQAKNGDDDAFVKAVQIDKRILIAIPYFNERFSAAHSGGEPEFLASLGRRLGTSPYVGKIRHKTLWLAFAILDQVGLLHTLSRSEILRICDDAGVGGYKNRIEDVTGLSKALNRYVTFQKKGIIATH